MRKNDAYSLRNLSLGRKLAATSALIAGLVVFAASWLVQVFLLSRETAGEIPVFDLGDTIATFAAKDPATYVVIATLNLGSLFGLLLITRRLFSRTALRMRVRRALALLSEALFTSNALCWLGIPFLGFMRALAGPVVLFTELVLVFTAALPVKEMWIYYRLSKPGSEKKRIVIVGGGFAGLYTALALDKKIGHRSDIEVEVLDKNNFFLFPPLLPSAATGTIETRQVTYPFRRILETTNVRFRKANVEAIDTAARRVVAAVELEDHAGGHMHREHLELGYDYLVLCPGSATNTFKTRGAEEHAFFMREIHDAMAVRNQIIDCFEQAAAETRDTGDDGRLRFVVVGAGPTGIEVVTEIHDLVHEVLLKRYPELDPQRIEIVVVQSGKQILPGWHDEIVRMAKAKLGTLAIRVILDARVTEVGPDFVLLGSGERLVTRTCIWCAGVRPAPLLERAGVPLDKSGRATIDADLRAAGLPEVFVIGDAAHLVDAKTQKPLPPLGQVAFQQGPHAAKNLIHLLEGRPTRPFKYFNFGSLVSVGEHYAAVDLLGIRLSGFIGWVVWRTLYLGKLVGMSNKLRVMLDWTLDLLIERSISQLTASPRRLVSAPHAVAASDGAPNATSSDLAADRLPVTSQKPAEGEAHG